MRKFIITLSLVFAFFINVNAGLFHHLRKDFEKDFPDHYPGRICLKDGTIHEFPAVRIWYTRDEEIWAWTNIEEFNKVTFDVNDVEWVEVWNAKAPEKVYHCIKFDKINYKGTYLLIKDVNNFRIMSQYLYFAINDSGDIQYHTYVSATYNYYETKGLPETIIYNTATDEITWGIGRHWVYGTIDFYKYIGSRMRAALKGNKELQKEASSTENWSLERIIDLLSRF